MKKLALFLTCAFTAQSLHTMAYTYETSALRRRSLHIAKTAAYTGASAFIVYHAAHGAGKFGIVASSNIAPFFNATPIETVYIGATTMCCCAAAGCWAGLRCVRPAIKAAEYHLVEACKKDQ